MEEISFDDVEEVINNFQGLNKTMHYMMMEKIMCIFRMHIIHMEVRSGRIY